MEDKKKFRFVWRTGKPTIIEGYDIHDAVLKSGYGGGAMVALDYWEEVEDKDAE